MGDGVKRINVMEPGSKVKVIGENLTCRVEQVSIRQENVVFYELSYWKAGSITTVWLHHSEIEEVDSPDLEIGFVTNG